MADIFLSYAREDEPRARLLAEALEECGWSVWWDRRIPHGKDFNAYIQQQLDAARCIVVLWSKAALASKFVRDEATEGLSDGRLVPLLIETVKQPLGFRQLQAADLSDWQAGRTHEEFDRLISAIGAVVPPALTAQLSPLSTTSQPASVGQIPPAYEHARAVSHAPQVQGTRTLGAEPGKSGGPEGPPPRGPARAGRVRRVLTVAVILGIVALAIIIGLKLRTPSRFNPSVWNLPAEDLLGFIEIPAGPFTMGSDKHKDSGADDDELPQHQVTLPSFFLGRYEVTVGQYKACVNDGGCKPGDRNALDGPDDLPVRYVSWHEALDYCGWLDATLKAWSGAPVTLAAALSGRRDRRAWHVTLPSEAEWERAARGTDGRIYPWGDRMDPANANSGEARGGPIPVGSFPGGASPHELLDMSGNVWEWTRSHYRSYPYRSDDGRESAKAGDDVLVAMRGGGAFDDRGSIRAASRYRIAPGFRDISIGFRVAVSPFAP